MRADVLMPPPRTVHCLADFASIPILKHTQINLQEESRQWSCSPARVDAYFYAYQDNCWFWEKHIFIIVGSGESIFWCLPRSARNDWMVLIKPQFCIVACGWLKILSSMAPGVWHRYAKDPSKLWGTQQQFTCWTYTRSRLSSLTLLVFVDWLMIHHVHTSS
jgi:hypothetical protein